MADFRVPISVSLDAFGVPATVTRPAPDHAPIATRGFWLSPRRDVDPFGSSRPKVAPRRVLVLPRTDVTLRDGSLAPAVPSLPSGTRIAAPLQLGGAALAWRFDGLDEEADVDEWRAIVKA